MSLASLQRPQSNVPLKHLHSKRKLFFLSLVAGLCLCLTLLCFLAIKKSENFYLQTIFDRLAHDRATVIEEKMRTHLSLLYFLKSFYAGSQNVEREEFKQFVEYFFIANPEISKAEWILRVPAAGRSAFEEQVKKEGFSEFQITQRDLQGQEVRVSERQDYFPIYYVEPFEKNRNILGRDATLPEVFQQEIAKAIDQNKPTLIPLLKLTANGQREYEMNMFMPIYQNDHPAHTIQERRGYLSGLVAVVTSIPTLVESALKSLKPGDINISLYYLPSSSGKQLMHFRQSRSSKEPFFHFANPEFKQEISFEIAGSRWVIEANAAPKFFRLHHQWASWIVLVTGILGTAVMTSYLYILFSRSAVVEKLVEERTEQLSLEIEKRGHAQERLRESEGRYRQLVELSPEGIFINQDGVFMFVNQAFISMLRAERSEDLIGKRVLDYVHPDYQNKAKERLESLRKENKSVPLMAEKYIRLDRTEIDVEVAAAPFIYQNKPADMVVVRDISEQVRLEEQFRQAQKIEAVGRLAGGVAHDFNNLLTVISGYTNIVLQTLDKKDPRYFQLNEVKEAAERSASLTQQLLAFSRRQILKPQTVDLNDLISKLEKMIRRLISENIELVIHPASDLGLIKVDPGQIEQLLINLVVNARDAMPRGGKILIETQNAVLDKSYMRQHFIVNPGEYIMISITDTGHGMTEEVKARLFEPFFTTKELGKGTGLGLSTCYGITKQAGGYIFVLSEVNRGTTFKIYFPRVFDKVLAEPAPAEPKSLPKGTEVILLVEDEDAVRTLSATILRKYGYFVYEAANGREALEVAEKNKNVEIHLVLSDLIMPEMGGQEMKKQLKTIRPNTKVLFTSGYTDDVIVHQEGLRPEVAFLQKPFSTHELLLKVRQVLDHIET